MPSNALSNSLYITPGEYCQNNIRPLFFPGILLNITVLNNQFPRALLYICFQFLSNVLELLQLLQLLQLFNGLYMIFMFLSVQKKSSIIQFAIGLFVLYICVEFRSPRVSHGRWWQRRRRGRPTGGPIGALRLTKGTDTLSETPCCRRCRRFSRRSSGFGYPRFWSVTGSVGLHLIVLSAQAPAHLATVNERKGGTAFTPRRVVKHYYRRGEGSGWSSYFW